MTFVALSVGLTPVFGQEFLKSLITKSPGPLSKHHQEWDALSGCIECHANRLGGDIQDVKCGNCHSEIQTRLQAKRGYHKDKDECHTCHDEHKGKDFDNFGPKDWLKKFNHTETDYELLGKHKAVDCADCHKTYRQHYKTKNPTTSRSYLDAPTDCYSCHRDDYEHKFSREEWLDCQLCHSSQIESWNKMPRKIRFDHDKTDYPLEGMHQEATCTSCHRFDEKDRRVTTFAPLAFESCTNCHYDVHEGALGDNCTTCHSVYRDWDKISTKKETKGKSAQNEKEFDHSKTKFPLKGYHEAVDCESCHSDPAANFKVAGDKFDECSDCHGFAHGEQFASQKCESCHAMEKKFQETSFTTERHNKTDFALTGKHQVLDCNKCHWAGNFENLPSATCDQCHRNPHDQRQIDKECSFCHVTTTFSWIQFDHNKQTDFRLTGQHRDVACLSCHVDEVFKNMPASNSNPNCQGCHADPHGDKMPNECQNCHSTETFKLPQNFDHGKSFGFNLAGRHAELSCQKCHSNHLKSDYTIALQQPGLSPQACANCHVDVHNRKYGMACDSCHSVQTFSVEFGAKVHDLGFFKLKGAHDQLGCTDCHRPDTNLQGTGIDCVWCHEKNDIHMGKMGPECGDCHQQTAWLPTSFKHNTTAFRLSGAHRYVECSSCHVNQVYQGLPTDCYFCHSDSQLSGTRNGSTPHTVGFIQECSQCHSTISWKIKRGSGMVP